MRTLEAFWHWVENEKPAAITTYAAREKTCTEVEMQAVDMALDAVKDRNGSRPWNDDAWNEYTPALKALSLAFCEALERMHEQVAKPVPMPSATFADLRKRFVREGDAASALLAPSPVLERGMALVRLSGIDLAEYGRWALAGYQDPPPDPCAKCGNPLHLHHPYPSEPGSCVPRIEGQFRPRHGDPRDDAFLDQWKRWVAQSPGSRGIYDFTEGERYVGLGFEFAGRTGTIVAVDNKARYVVVDFNFLGHGFLDVQNLV